MNPIDLSWRASFPSFPVDGRGLFVKVLVKEVRFICRLGTRTYRLGIDFGN